MINDLTRNICGNCMFHLPGEQVNPSDITAKIKSGSATGQPSFWMCGCSKAKSFKKGRSWDGGARCSHFDCRYDSHKKLDEWVANCHKAKDKSTVVSTKSRRGRPRTRSARPDDTTRPYNNMVWQDRRRNNNSSK